MNKLTVKFLLLFTIVVVSVGASFGQVVYDFRKAPSLTEDDVRDLVRKYQEMDVKTLQNDLARVKPDRNAKQAIAGLPDDWKPLLRTVAQVGDSRLWLVGQKALKLSGSSKYEFIYLENRAPLAVSDSNVLLLISSEMLNLTQNDDDALLGTMFHELAHGLMVERSLAAKIRFNDAYRKKDYAAAEKARYELALIELECDLAAAKLLVSANRRIDGFARLQKILEAAEKDLNIAPAVQLHPDSDVRKRALLALNPGSPNLAVNK